MYNYYGIYTACRDAAWRCHIDFSVKTLPVRLVPLAHMAGIRIIKNSDANELNKDEEGASLFLNGQWVIVYDDTLDIPSARMVIAHELGHIFLGHEYKYSGCRFVCGDSKLKSEREADLFAIRLLAPACVLHELGIIRAEDISVLCDIPKAAAKKRSHRMETLEGRKCYYKSHLEAKVADNFKEFIRHRSSSQSSNE